MNLLNDGIILKVSYSQMSDFKLRKLTKGK